MNLSVILEKKPGSIAPVEMIEHLNKLRGSVSGFAIRHAVDGKPAIEFEFADTAQVTAQYMKIQQAAKDNSLVLFFSDKKGKFDTGKDIQPFMLMDGDDPMLAVFIEGDFPKYSNPGGTRSDEGNFYEQFVEPLLIEAASEAKDLEAFYAKLRKKTLQDSLINASHHRCVFCLVPLTGDIISFGNNEIGKAYEWGNISDNTPFDKAEEKHVVAQVASAVAKGTRRFFSAASDSPVPAVTPQVPQTPDTKHVAPTQPDVEKHVADGGKTDTAISAGSVWCKPDKSWEKGLCNAWYRHFNGGQLPKNHEGKPAILVSPDKVEFAQRPLKTLNDLKLLVAEMKNGKQIIKPKDFKEAHAAIEGEKHVVGGTTIVDTRKPQNLSDYIPDMNKAEVEKTMEVILGFMPSDASKRPTLLDLQKIEEAWGKFSAKVGVPLVDTMYWAPDQLMQLEKKALVQLLNEYKMVYRATKEFQTAVAAEAEARQAAAKVVHQTAKEELAPEPQKIAAAGGGKRRFFS